MPRHAPHSQLAQEIEQTFRDTEALLGVSLTVHDLKRAFVDSDGKCMLNNIRRRHRRPVCQIVHDHRCIDHCMGHVNRQLSERTAPLKHCCWKQVTEVAAGLYIDQQHVATIFAGQFRLPDPQLPIDPRWEQVYRKLRLTDPDWLDSCGRIIQAMGQGILARIAASVSQAMPSDRKSQITRWLRDHASDESTLEDLASVLYLSVSRTSHLVRQLFGHSFRQLLQQQRLEQARQLLLTTDQTTEAIAHAVGMQSPYHFNRAFKQNFGIPPGRFRREARNEA
jgi:AraC-like DNA-binding protein